MQSGHKRSPKLDLANVSNELSFTEESNCDNFEIELGSPIRNSLQTPGKNTLGEPENETRNGKIISENLMKKKASDQLFAEVVNDPNVNFDFSAFRSVKSRKLGDLRKKLFQMKKKSAHNEKRNHKKLSKKKFGEKTKNKLLSKNFEFLNKEGVKKNLIRKINLNEYNRKADAKLRESIRRSERESERKTKENELKKNEDKIISRSKDLKAKKKDNSGQNLSVIGKVSTAKFKDFVRDSVSKYDREENLSQKSSHQVLVRVNKKLKNDVDTEKNQLKGAVSRNEIKNSGLSEISRVSIKSQLIENFYEPNIQVSKPGKIIFKTFFEI